MTWEEISIIFFSKSMTFDNPTIIYDYQVNVAKDSDMFGFFSKVQILIDWAINISIEHSYQNVYRWRGIV